MPEPTAKLYQIKPGDTAERLAVQEFAAAVRDGHDLRYYENVLLAVNRDKNRAGIRGTFQDPNILGGGANNIQLEAGRRIWLVSPAYARALEGKVPDGSLTNGMYGKAKRVLGHIEDLVRSVTESPRYFGTVAGEYAQAIKDHLPEIIGITAGFILAESASAFLAATPTGVGQLAAVVIQLALAAFGAKFAVDACTQALTHGEQWLTLAWTAHGDVKQLAAASQSYLKMLVSIAMAALAIAGVRGNMGKGLKIADAIKIQPPRLGMSPAMVTPSGQVIPGGPVFMPGSIATTGPVDIGPSLMAAVGSGGGRARPEESDSNKSDATAKEASGPRSGSLTVKAPAVRHRLRSVRQGTYTRKLNTVIEPGVDVAGDIAAIQQGLAKRVGNTVEVNQRVYGIEEGGTLYPISGPGFHQLNRGAFQALGVLNQFGNTSKAMEILAKMKNVGPAEIEAALRAWRAGQ